MGLQFRTRTKGKNSWVNVSHSKKNGLSASLSVKLDKNLTMNFGGKGNRRATINFGNGIRYVKYRTPKGRTKKEVSSPSYSYDYTPVEVTKPVTEVLGMCQQAILDNIPTSGITHHGDMQAIADVFNAIDFMIVDPNSLENRDLMLVTINQFVEIAEARGSEDLAKTANIIRDYIRSVLPKKEIQQSKVEETYNKTVVWGTVIGICVLAAMCSV